MRMVYNFQALTSPSKSIPASYDKLSSPALFNSFGVTDYSPSRRIVILLKLPISTDVMLWKLGHALEPQYHRGSHQGKVLGAQTGRGSCIG